MVPGIWLQMHVKSGMKYLPEPLLFLDLPGRQTRKEINAWDYLPAVRDAFMVSGIKIGPDTESRIENCMRRFFQTTRNFRLGVDLSKKNSNVRLSVFNGVWEEVLTEALQDGGSETRQALDLSLIKSLSEIQGSDVSSILVFSDKRTQCSGFEIALSRVNVDERPENRQMETSLLERCASLGLMTAEQVLPIKNWPGAEKVFLDANDWTEKGSIWERRIDRIEIFPNHEGNPQISVDLICNRAL